MRRIPESVLARMARGLAKGARDEMAIPSYLHRNPVMRWMAWRRVEVVARHLRRTCAARPPGASAAVMDYGCGTGVLLDEASRHAQRVYGVDLVLDAARLLAEEWQLSKVTLFSPEGARSRIGRESVDVILAAEVLEHIDPLDDTLSFFRDRLKPDGRLLVSVPTENGLYRLGRRLAGFRGEYHHGNAASIDRAIVRAGFRRERLEKIPAPGPLAIYWVVDYGVA
ncbi:MAG: class I SAM-dependent methyltransferase [Planctomycetota bacterium]|jgi:2-polyprenyl-3-methyl-5-hydroxy-6-metoxy-1,4-benzoquinol methylase